MTSILVVDDHELLRRGVRRLLEALPGWTVAGEAAEGGKAVEEAARLRPDVVVLDVFMPGLDGIAATRQLRTRAPGSTVLVYTMHESDDLVAEVFDAGARGFVLKSDPARYLVAAVEALAHHGQFVTPTLADAVVNACAGRAPRRHPGERTALTAREREVVRRLATGEANRDVALALGISIKTVETHRANVLRKLEMASIVDIVRYAVRNRLVEA